MYVINLSVESFGRRGDRQQGREGGEGGLNFPPPMH